MKHQYFGDVNDYVKYGILRCFAAEDFRVGILWMLTPPDGHPDGRKIKYLSQPETWKRHDAELFAVLSNALSKANGKDLRHIECNGNIPNGQFWGDVVPDRKAERSVWYRKAISSLRKSDLLFFDPDNGIEVPSKPLGRKDSSKYVYWEELECAWKQKKSLLVFQHFPRVKRNEYIPTMVTQMRQRLKGAYVVPLIASNVLFLFAHRAVERPRVSRATRLIEKKWSRRVSEYGAMTGRAAGNAHEAACLNRNGAQNTESAPGTRCAR